MSLNGIRNSKIGQHGDFFGEKLAAITPPPKMEFGQVAGNFMLVRPAYICPTPDT
jgi:hypothetical protein